MVLRTYIFARGLGTFAVAAWLLAPASATRAEEPPFDWSGIHAGAAAGYSVRTFDYDFNFGGLAAEGATGGGSDRDESEVISVSAGASYQTGRLVLGIEGDVTWRDRAGKEQLVFAVPGDEDDQFVAVSWLGTMASLRGRVGFAWNRLHIFATAGAAWADLDTSVTASSEDGSFPTTLFSDSKSLTGWTIGGGIEYALSSNWSARVEYRHWDLGALEMTMNDDIMAPVYTPAHLETEVELDDVRAGLTYRF